MAHLVLGFAVDGGALVAERAAELRELGWHTPLALAAARAYDLASRQRMPLSPPAAPVSPAT